jgi:MinD-like ATPase involved in chromosome partitioning or flagellar assembly
LTRPARSFSIEAMAQPMIIATHSYRGGTGKSNVSANLALELARSGHRVGVVDTDLPSPGVHILFAQDQPPTTVNGVLYRHYGVDKAMIDVTPAELGGDGRIWLLAGSPKPGDIAQIVKEGYALEQLIDIYRDFCKAAALDFLFVDTHPGINETTLMSITVADLLLMLLRPDRQDYQGTAVTVDVARKLGVPALRFVVNKAITSLDWPNLKTTIEQTYGDQCLAILPQSDEIMRYGGNGLFCLQQPDHPLSVALREVAQSIAALRS